MNFLIIDTSTSQSFIALSKGENLVIELLPSPKQSQLLLPAIEKLLDGEKVDFIAIGTGPGSFTGTRIGVMAAKALSFSLGIPLLSFCSLKIFTPEEDGPFIIQEDAKSQGFYTLNGNKTGNFVEYQTPYLQPTGNPSTALNIPFLAIYLQEKFEQVDLSFHRDIQVSYLSTMI